MFLVLLSAYAQTIAPVHAQTEPLYVQASRAHVRAQPVIAPDNILDTLERGTEVAVLGQAEDWYEVQLPDARSGWMHQSVLGAAPPAPELSTAAPGVTRLPLLRVGIVLDGPSPQHDPLLKLFENEIREVLKDERNVQFPRNMVLEADWTSGGVETAIDRLLADPGVDVVLALSRGQSSPAPPQARVCAVCPRP
jgi:hypothetical protein